MAKVYFYYAAMNAGKSTVLLQSSYNYRERGLHTLLFTPAIDTRHGTGRIASRIGLHAGAIPLGGDDQLLERVLTEHARRPVACVLIDEAQFLTTAQVRELHQMAVLQGVPVICYGLRTDFQGNGFEGAAALGLLADQIEELKTVCGCGRKASFNVRLDAEGRRVREGEQVAIGGDAQYHAACPHSFYTERCKD